MWRAWALLAAAVIALNVALHMTMMVAVVMFLLGTFGMLCWMYGRVYEAHVDYRQEQLDYQAYEWAAAHGRLPTVHHYIDSETGETLGSEEK